MKNMSKNMSQLFKIKMLTSNAFFFACEDTKHVSKTQKVIQY